MRCVVGAERCWRGWCVLVSCVVCPCSCVGRGCSAAVVLRVRIPFIPFLRDAQVVCDFFSLRRCWCCCCCVCCCGLFLVVVGWRVRIPFFFVMRGRDDACLVRGRCWVGFSRRSKGRVLFHFLFFFRCRINCRDQCCDDTNDTSPGHVDSILLIQVM